MTDPFFRSGVAGLDRVSFDVGLRAHTQRVFGLMSGGLAVTGLVAWLVANVPALTQAIYGTPLRFVAMILPFAFILFFNFRAMAASSGTLRAVFWAFSAAMGLSLGSIFLVYSNASVARAFFVTAADFGAMALYGYTTRRDLTGMGSFMMMGLLGVIIASFVNVFMMSSMLQWMVSVASVVIFTGLTAYDSQTIKQSYAESYGAEANEKLALFGALRLYLDSINLFMAILQLTGSRRD